MITYSKEVEYEKEINLVMPVKFENDEIKEE